MSIKTLFNKLNFKPKKKLGQNFLYDKKISNRILHYIPGNKNLSFIEIGPGLGALTIPFIQIYKKLLFAIEIDSQLVNYLSNYNLINKNLIIYKQNILNFDFTNFFFSQPKQFKLCIFGNLPYKIVNKLFLNIFKHLSVIDSMYFMVQKEVGERIVATHNQKKYGKLTIFVKYFCKSKYLFEINNTCFYPKPTIQSAFIKLIPHKNYNNDCESYRFQSIFKLIVTLAFNKRRKILLNSLNFIKNIKNILINLNINPNLRAENLSIHNYYKICKTIYTDIKNKKFNT